ncbi:MAG: ribosome maturation factor RimP [Ectobacillus sp.]
MSKSVTEIVEKLAQPIVEELNLELVDVEYVKEGKDWFLRVFVDSETGIDIEECGMVSERLSEALDKADPIPHLYFLDVSSPGAERPLKKEEDFHKAVGKQIAIKTVDPSEGEQMYEGKLQAFDGTTLTLAVIIKTRKKEIQIPMEKVASARLAVTF